MMHTTIALLLAFAPIAAGFVAFAIAAIIASVRVARIERAPFVPEATPNEAAAWAARIGASLETCEECVAACSAPRVLLASTVETIDAFRAERAAVDAWIAARPEAAPVAPRAAIEARRFVARNRRGVAAAAARIAVRIAREHDKQAITLDAPTLANGRKLTSALPSFAAEVREAFAVDVDAIEASPETQRSPAFAPVRERSINVA